MLQRIQTVYLFLAFVFCLLYLIFPLAKITVGDEVFVLKSYELKAPDVIIERLNIWLLQTILLASLFLSKIISIYTTLRYKNRILQIRLGKLNILLLLILVVFSFFYIDSVKSQLSAEIQYSAGIFFPFISMILILLANKAIKKDEDLVRSADRIR